MIRAIGIARDHDVITYNRWCIDRVIYIFYGEEMKSEDAQNIIKKLDSIFGKETSFTFSPMSFFSAQHYRGHILIEGSENELLPEIIAHEYAHRITRRRAGKDPHTKTYFTHYKLICSHLGIKPKSLWWIGNGGA